MRYGNSTNTQENQGYGCGYLSDGCGGTILYDGCTSNQVCALGPENNDCVTEGDWATCEFYQDQRGHCLSNTQYPCVRVVEISGFNDWGRQFCYTNSPTQQINSACQPASGSFEYPVYRRDSDWYCEEDTSPCYTKKP